MTTPLAILSALAEQHRLADGDTLARALSDRAVKAAKATDKPAKLADGGGLTLYIPPSGRKVWHYRYTLGKEQIFTLGAYPEIGLADARAMHRAARWLVARGVHPKSHVDAEIAAARAAEQAAKSADAHTFAAACQQWQDATAKSLAPRTAQHRRAMIATYLIPKLGSRPLSNIRRKELVELLSAIDAEAPITAKHCRGYLKQCFDFAVDRELVDGNPTPAAAVLVHAQARRETPRKSLPMSKMGSFLHALETTGETIWHTKAGLRLLVLTWCRTAEITGARAEEFDIGVGIWRIPAERMKARRGHVVYLSTQACVLVQDLLKRQSDDPRKAGYLFPNWRRNGSGHAGRMTYNQWLTRHGWHQTCDIHGFRATASTWANESGRYRPDVIEVALAHSDKDKVRSAYNRSTYQSELRKLWQDWADELDRCEAAARASGGAQ